MRFKNKIMEIGLNRVKRMFQCFFPVFLAVVVLIWQMGCTLVADFSDPKRSDGGGVLDANPDDDGAIHDGSIHDGGTEDGDITAECGNNIREGNEKCDGNDLGEHSCVSEGFSGGDLGCMDDCSDFDTSQCWTCGNSMCQEVKGENFQNCSEDCGIIDISTGENHACAVKYDGTLWCWGNNEKGQLGTGGSLVTSSSPVEVQVIDYSDGKVKQVSAGGNHTCAVTESGDLYCWGLNDNGQVGNGNSETPVSTPQRIYSLETVAQVSAGGDHTCAVKESGELYCWGNNTSGQLGNNDPLESFDSPQTVFGVSDIQQVAAGKAHTCAINQMNQLYCWGNNQSKQVGQETENVYGYPQMVGHSEVQGVTLVSAGGKHTCAINDSGELFCWGDNEFGQLGVGGIVTDHIPTQVVDPFGSNAVIVSCGFDHTCGVKSSGEVYCWGNNDTGQLGIGQSGSGSYEETPVLVEFLYSVQKISSGLKFTCMISKGVPWCWGSNANGQLGISQQSGSYDSPQPVTWPPVVQE